MSPAVAQSDIDALLLHAQSAVASMHASTASELPTGVKPLKLPDFSSAGATTSAATLNINREVELDLRIELGRTRLHAEDVLKLSQGSVVRLDKLEGEPVDVFVNGRLIARAEVLILNENFCVRVSELVTQEAMLHAA